MFVKICGLTSRTAVKAAVDAGADALGFVFARSIRFVTPDTAAELCHDLPDHIIRVAVMRHPTQALWARVRDDFWPDWLQTEAEDFEQLEVPAGCRPLPVYRDKGIAKNMPKKWPARILFEGELSGAGESADWGLAREVAEETRVILAGGLHPDNVADAIRSVRPWGVDVSSGVERAPGDKCPKRIGKFIAQARAAEFNG